jgi:hypothetical protein
MLQCSDAPPGPQLLRQLYWSSPPNQQALTIARGSQLAVCCCQSTSALRSCSAGHGSHDWKPRRKLKSKLTNDPRSIRNPSGWLKTACMAAMKPEPPAPTQRCISPIFRGQGRRCGDDKQSAWQSTSSDSGGRWMANSWDASDRRTWRQQHEVDNTGARGDSRGGNSSSHWGNGGGWNSGAGRELPPGGSHGWPRGSKELTSW